MHGLTPFEFYLFWRYVALNFT
uniref:Uncharacterized protein n=1 Tax=Anguilla anguilla TaxID=7936 RepID=A0A0E9UID0_ANGAN